MNRCYRGEPTDAEETHIIRYVASCANRFSCFPFKNPFYLVRSQFMCDSDGT